MKKTRVLLWVVLILTVFALVGCDAISSISQKDNDTAPAIEISDDGYWVINGVKSTVKAIGQDGINGTNGVDGKDGVTPTIEISDDGYWIINGEKTPVKAMGQDGKNGTTPTIEISTDGYWIINGEKSAIRAIGKDGKNGLDGIRGDNGDNGKDGNGIASAVINGDGELVITFDNGTVTNLGQIKDVHPHEVKPIEWIEKKATCSQYGIKYVICETCGELVKTVIIPKPAHIVDEYGICTVCGYDPSIVYEKIEGKDEYRVTGYTSNSPKVVIPCEHLDLPVTEIGDYAFFNNQTITEIIIPDSVISLGDNVFDSCTMLANVIIPHSITSVGYDTFYCCNSLTSITIPDNITSMSSGMFDGCSRLQSITISNSVTSIGSTSLAGCLKLRTINFDGTIAQWKSIDKHNSWNLFDSEECVIICTDGTIGINE